MLQVEALEDRTVPAIIDVNPVAVPTALNNDFTVLQNAVSSAASGDTINLHGTFNWTEVNASASYVLSVGASDTADIRGIKVPDGINNLTITSSTNDAHIVGKGDFDSNVFDAFLFTDDSTSANGGANAIGNTNLTVEDLNIDNFESAVTMGWNSTGIYNGTKIQDNSITLGGDNFGTQNIAIYFWKGTNQQVTGNTINYDGNGTRAAGARSFGFQDGTTGGTGYDGLLINNNIFQLAAISTGAEIDNGIWENGHNDDNSSHISITNNQFLGRTSIDDFDRALLLSSQTTGLVVDGNHFTDVDKVFYTSQSQGLSAGDQFTFTNNILTRVGGTDGVFLQNVTDDPVPVHVGINWNINNTIDGFTGVRGLNELSTQATGSSRPSGAATDLNAVVGVGTNATTFVEASWSGAGRFTDPDGIGAGAGPLAFSFNSFATIQAGINAVDASGTVKVLAGTYNENVDATTKIVTLAPGASPGLVKLNGNLTLGARDTFEVDIASATPGTGYNQWIVNGNVTLGGATLNMNFNYVPAVSDSPFVFIDNQGSNPISGTFAPTPTGTGFTALAPTPGGSARIQVPNSSSTSNIIYYILYDGPGHTGNNMVLDKAITAGILTAPSGLTAGDSVTSQTVFTFASANPNSVANDFIAIVNTGDATLTGGGSPGPVQIVQTGVGTFEVQLTYTYQKALTDQTFSVSVIDGNGQTAIASTTQFSVAGTVNAPAFSDNFDRSDAPTLGSNWTTQTGTFGISSDTAIASTSQESVATVNSLSLTNVVVQADINLTTPGSTAGLVARYSGPAESNFYLGLVYFDGSTYSADLFVNHGGAFTRLSVQSLPGFAGAGSLRFEVVGNQLKLFINNVLQGVAYDSSIATAGSVGMRGIAASLDNFAATSVQGLQANLPFTDAFTKPDDSDLDRVWTEQVGAFTTQAQEAAAAQLAGVSIATVNAALSSDVILQADVNITTAGSHAGLVARYSGPSESNFYLGLIYFDGSTYSADLFVNHGGTYTRLSAQSVLGFSGIGTLRFEVVGNELKLFVNNVLQGVAHDSTISTPGLVGMRAMNASLDNFDASNVQVLQASLPFSDQFSKPDNSDLDRVWTDQIGAFTTQNEQAADAVNLAPVSLATLNGASAADVTVQAQIALNGIGSGAGLVARYTGPGQSNFYLGMLFNNNGVYQALIFLNQGGNFTKLASQDLPGIPIPGELRFVVSGSSLTLFVDGVQQASATNFILTAPGQVGIRSANASLDDFNAQ